MIGNVSHKSQFFPYEFLPPFRKYALPGHSREPPCKTLSPSGNARRDMRGFLPKSLEPHEYDELGTWLTDLVMTSCNKSVSGRSAVASKRSHTGNGTVSS